MNICIDTFMICLNEHGNITCTRVYTCAPRYLPSHKQKAHTNTSICHILIYAYTQISVAEQARDQHENEKWRDFAGMRTPSG